MDVYYIVAFLLLAVLYLAIFALGLTEYIISSIAFFRIARKRGVSNPWLAWIPIAKTWIFGSIVDNFESEKGSKRKFRVILLTLSLVISALAILAVIVLVVYSVIIAFSSNSIPTGDEDIAFLISYFVVVLPLSFIAMAYYAVDIICLYKIHENIYSEKSVKYVIVSFLVPLGRSICLFKNSKRCEEKVVFEPAAPVVEAEPEVIAEEPTEETVEEVVETEDEKTEEE